MGLSVRLNRSTKAAFWSLSNAKWWMLLVVINPVNSRLKNSFPLSVCSRSGLRGFADVRTNLNASRIDFQSLYFTRTDKALFENTSITVKIYLFPLLSRWSLTISAQSACHCLSILPTKIGLRGKWRLAGLWRAYARCRDKNHVQHYGEYEELNLPMLAGKNARRHLIIPCRLPSCTIF